MGRAAAILLLSVLGGVLWGMGAADGEPFEVFYTVDGVRPAITLDLHILPDGRGELNLGTSDSLPPTGTDAVGNFAELLPASLLRRIGADLSRAGLPARPPKESSEGLPPSIFRSMTVWRGGRRASFRLPDDQRATAYQVLEGHLLDAARLLALQPRRALTATLTVTPEGDGLRPVVVLRSVGSEPAVFAAIDPDTSGNSLSVMLLVERSGALLASTQTDAAYLQALVDQGRLAASPVELSPGATLELPLPLWLPPTDGPVELRAVVDFVLPRPDGSIRRAQLRTAPIAGSRSTPAPVAAADDEPPSLALYAASAKPRYAQGEPVVVCVSLKNTGREPITVIGRMLLNHPDAPDSYRDLTMDVAGPEGYRSSVVYFVNAGAPSAQDAKRLGPGELVSRTLDLSSYESLHEPGAYRIVFRYRNTTRIEGMDAWQGEIDAAPLIVERAP